MSNYYKGYVYTRNPITGDNILYGKIENIFENKYINQNIFEEDFESLFKIVQPNRYDELCAICKKIENHFGKMMYIEFEIIEDKIWIVSCDYGKRTPRAALKIACDLAEEKEKNNNSSLFNNNCFDVINEYLNYTDGNENLKEQTCYKKYTKKDKCFKEKTGYKRYTKIDIKKDNRRK